MCTFGNEIFLEKYLFILFIIYDGGSCQGKWPGVIKILKYCNSEGKLFKLNQNSLFVRALKLCHFVKFNRSRVFKTNYTICAPYQNSLPLNVFPSQLQFTCFGCFSIHIRQQNPLSAMFNIQHI